MDDKGEKGTKVFTVDKSVKKGASCQGRGARKAEF